MSTNQTLVTCDDSRHARGKIAKIATIRSAQFISDFGFDAIKVEFVEPEELYGNTPSKPVRLSRTVEGHWKSANPNDHSQPLRKRYKFVCPLCPRRVDLTDTKLAAIFERLGKEGVESVSLAGLSLVASISN